MRLKVLAITAAIMASLVGFAPLAAETTPGEVIQKQVQDGIIDVIPNVVYSQIKTVRNNRPLKMTVLVPRNDLLKPAIIYFPGGGFTSADHEKFIQMRLALAKAGFVVAAAEYRTVPDKFPALLNDAKSAIRYLRAHAKEYGIDPSRIGVLGDSAGGYLSMMAGVTGDESGWDKGDYLDQRSDVQAVASLYGISDLRNIGEGFHPDIQKIHESPAVTEALLVNGPAFDVRPGLNIKELGEKAAQASPISHIKENEPPFLLMHGDQDALVSRVQSDQMYEALKAKNQDVKYYVLKDAAHGDASWYQPNVISIVTNWFEEKLGKPIAPTEVKTTGQSSAVPSANL
ncbi:MAG: alpha/beta hydrolase [Burkholderiales bacterium]|nr:alpha/beta hydrolase [Burkholderiales bacterium]